MAKKATTPKKTLPRRKHTRFKADPGAIAFILADEKGQKMNPPLQCLILQESYAGAGLVALKTDLIKKGRQISIKVGLLEPSLCEIKWTQSLSGDVVSFGVEYCE